jgi:hypothetical protein
MTDYVSFLPQTAMWRTRIIELQSALQWRGTSPFLAVRTPREIHGLIEEAIIAVTHHLADRSQGGKHE